MATSPLRVLTVHKGDMRFDIAAGVDTPLSTSLSTIGMHVFDPAIAVVDANGNPIDVAATPAESLPDGSAIAVVRRSEVTTARSAQESAATPAVTRTSGLWWMSLGFPALALLLAFGENIGQLPALPPLARYLGCAVLMVIAFTAMVSTTAALPLEDLPWPGLVATAASAFAGGVLLGPADITRASEFGVLLGLSAVAVVFAFGYSRARGTLMGRTAGMLLILAIIIVVVWMIPFVLDMPSSVACALLTGVSPLALRAIPTFCLEVPESQLVDVESNATQRWTVRGVRPGRPRPIGTRAVTKTIVAAERQANMGIVIFAILPAICLPAVYLQVLPGTLPWWGMCVLTASVLLTYAYAPRTARSRPARHAPRVSAAVVLIEFVWIVGPDLPETVVFAGMGAAILIAFILIGVSVPVFRGVKSLGMSRIGDILQALGTALSLPAGLIAADMFDSIREMLS